MKHLLLTLRGRERDDSDGGFTLVELLVVMIIIGILAAIAIPIFTNQQKTAKDATVASDVRTIATSIETVRTKYPDATFYSIASGNQTALTTAPTESNANIGGTNGFITVFVGDSNTEFVAVRVSVSVGNRFTVDNDDNDPGTFEIAAWNSKGKSWSGVDDDHKLVYTSASGGLQY